MNKSLNVFLSVLLCFVLYAGVLTSLYTTDDSASQHYQTEYTSSIPTGIGAPSVSFGVGARGNDLAVPMSSRPSRGSVRHLSSHRLVTSSPNSPIASSPNSPIASSPNSLITYTSSSQTMKSFGGGSNAAGVSMSSGVVSSNATSSPTSFVSMSSNLPSPLAYYPQSTTSFDGAQLTFAASSLQEIGASAVSYGASAPRGISGRRNVSPGISNQYYGWLTSWWGEDESGKGWAHNTGGAITIEELEALFYSMTGATSFSNPQAWESFYNWFMNQINTNGEVSYNGYSWYLPLSDAIPFVLLLCLVYVVVVYRRNKMAKNVKAEK